MEITVQKKVWLRDPYRYFYFDEYELTYRSTKKLKSNYYEFELIEIQKLNDEQFTGGGGYIVEDIPRLGYKIRLRRHSDKWGTRQWSKVVSWFNVKKPNKDEDYIQTPVELYPE